MFMAYHDSINKFQFEFEIHVCIIKFWYVVGSPRIYIYRAREQTHTFVTLSISILYFTACFPAAIFLDVQGMFDAVKP